MRTPLNQRTWYAVGTAFCLHSDQRRTRSYETLRYAQAKAPPERGLPVKEDPLLTQAIRHARVAKVAYEGVARAGLIPEDVRLVTAKVVAGDGVVGGLRSAPDHDLAEKSGGVRGVTIVSPRMARLRPSGWTCRLNDRALRSGGADPPPPVPPHLPPTGSEPWWPTTLWCVS